MTEFEQAFKKYHRLMAYAVRQTGINPAHIQDCVQEAALKLSEMSTISYIEPHRVRGLFCRVAVNIARDKIRHEQVHSQSSCDKDAIQPQAIFSTTEKGMHRSLAVHQTLSELSEMDSFIAWHYYAQEHSIKEISDMLKARGVNWSTKRVYGYIRTNLYPRLKDKLKPVIA